MGDSLSWPEVLEVLVLFHFIKRQRWMNSLSPTPSSCHLQPSTKNGLAQVTKMFPWWEPVAQLISTFSAAFSTDDHSLILETTHLILLLTSLAVPVWSPSLVSPCLPNQPLVSQSLLSSFSVHSPSDLTSLMILSPLTIPILTSPAPTSPCIGSQVNLNSWKCSRWRGLLS